MGFELKVYIEPSDAVNCGRCKMLNSRYENYENTYLCTLFGDLKKDEYLDPVRHDDCNAAEQKSRS